MYTMNRRSFIQTASLGTAALNLPLSIPISKPSHLITISFDDGFKKSFLEAARIHEQFGLSGCFNVIASAHLPEFVSPDDYIIKELMGDFDTWNSLRERGHEVMMHSWAHNNLGKIEFEQATSLIDQCIDYFTEHLDGFEQEKSIFNFPFNSSTPELEAYVLTKVRALRTGGTWSAMPFPTAGARVLSCVLYPRPGNGDEWVETTISEFLSRDGGWLILNTHGLGEEGWGPITAECLKRTLDRLVNLDHVEVLTVTQVLDNYT